MIDARKAYYARNAAIYAKLDAVEARAADARPDESEDVVQDMNALRGDYLAAARDAAARFDPFVIEVTRQIVLLHIAAKRDMLAQAESELLREPSAGRHLFSVELGASLYRAMAAEHKEYLEYERAQHAGLDEPALKARFGPMPPFDVGDAERWAVMDELPDLAGHVDEDSASWRSVSGITRGTSAAPPGPNGEARVRISFNDIVDTYDNTSCYETGKVVGVTWSGDQGHLDYETVCSVVGQRTEVTKIEPVILPAAEAKAIRPGENLLAMVDKKSRAGVVIRSLAAGRAKAKGVTQVLQVRGSRL